MAESLHPWLLDYFAENARLIGAEESKIPLHKKRKKLQLIKVLSGDDDPDVWAMVSDKDRKVTARFCRAESSIKQGILRHRSAIISVSDFKGILARTPLQGQRKLSEDRSLVLECQDAKLLGSFGEPTFGSPTPLTHLAALEHSLGKPGRAPSPKPIHQTTLPVVQMASIQMQPLPQLKRIRDKSDPLTAYMKSWQDFEQTTGAAWRDMVVVPDESTDYSNSWEDFSQTSGPSFRNMAVTTAEMVDHSSSWQDFAPISGPEFRELSVIQDENELSETDKISAEHFPLETAKSPSSAFRESLRLDGRGYSWITEAEIRDILHNIS